MGMTSLFQMKAKTNLSLKPGTEDIIQKIESAKNFSKNYTLTQSPENDLIANRFKSIIFKASENSLLQTVTYHFWKMAFDSPEYYYITLSSKDRQLVSIEHKLDSDVPIKFFKITDEKEVDVIPYGAPRL
jgi:hypothetical protein